MILTLQHQRPPNVYVRDGMRYATQPLIDAEEWESLAQYADCYRHESVGPGPYTEWTLTSDEHGPLMQRTTRDLTAGELDAARAQKLNALYQRRVQAEKDNFTHTDGRQYDGGDDTLHRLSVVARQITLALMAGTPGDTVVIQGGWRDVTDTGGPSTIAELQALLNSHYQHGVACERNSQVLKAAINAATTVDELNAIDLNEGWPTS